jgi:hypothetical protein
VHMTYRPRPGDREARRRAERRRAERALRAVVAPFPGLGIAGLSTPSPDLRGDRAELLDDAGVDQFERALDVLGTVPRDPRQPHAWLDSYNGKHLAEAICGDYIANGPFVCAALALGFAVEPYGAPSRNARVLVPKAWLRTLIRRIAAGERATGEQRLEEERRAE